MTCVRDVVIDGGGHNAPVAAAYLARSGKTVTVPMPARCSRQVSKIY